MGATKEDSTSENSKAPGAWFYCIVVERDQAKGVGRRSPAKFSKM